MNLRLNAFAAFAAIGLFAAPAVAADQTFWPDAGVHVVDNINMDGDMVTVSGPIYRPGYDANNPNGIGSFTVSADATHICYGAVGDIGCDNPPPQDGNYYAVFVLQPAGPLTRGEKLVVIFLEDLRG